MLKIKRCLRKGKLSILNSAGNSREFQSTIQIIISNNIYSLSLLLISDTTRVQKRPHKGQQECSPDTNDKTAAGELWPAYSTRRHPDTYTNTSTRLVAVWGLVTREQMLSTASHKVLCDLKLSKDEIVRDIFPSS